MARIAVEGGGPALECADGEPLVRALARGGIAVETPCGGRGTCGKCRVRFLEGAPGPSAADLALLGARELEGGARLACQARACGRMRLERPAQAGPLDALSDGASPQVELAPAFSGLGLAVDIGTTTVVASLVDAGSGETLASASGANAQGRFGADVLTRISYEAEHPGTGAAELQGAIVGQLNDLAGRACAAAGVSPSQVMEVDVAANATMAHMLLGADARGIGSAPHRPAFTGARDVPAASVGLGLAGGARLYCLPAASAFIGSDVVAGVFACGLGRGGETALLVDIGTNGEMVLAAGGRLLGCSCAAGPALEGMGVACGTRAAPGAVEEVAISGGDVSLATVGGLPAAGLCGSGVLAAVREMLRAGIVRPNGALARPESLPAGDPRRRLLAQGEGGRRCLLDRDGRVFMTQRDVRQVQLAKGAVLSGALALLEQAGVAPRDLGRTVVAGQFGAHLSRESLEGCGILPAGCAGRAEYAGNSSLGGARAALLSEPAKREMESLAGRVSYVDLALLEGYDRLLASCMAFPNPAREGGRG